MKLPILSRIFQLQKVIFYCEKLQSNENETVQGDGRSVVCLTRTGLISDLSRLSVCRFTKQSSFSWRFVARRFGGAVEDTSGCLATAETKTVGSLNSASIACSEKRNTVFARSCQWSNALSWSNAIGYLHLRQESSFPSCWCPVDKLSLYSDCCRTNTLGLTSLQWKKKRY